MLTIYRRHKQACGHRGKGRGYRGCQCPIWVDGFLGAREIRQSLKLRDWQKAQETVRDWEARGSIEPDPEPGSEQLVTVEGACAQFLQDAQARNLKPPTIYKYDLLFRQMQTFAVREGLRFIREFDVEQVRKFRASWTNRNLAARKKFEHLRAFFRFCFESAWVPSNPAAKMKPPRTSEPPTAPFTPDELTRIMAALDSYPDKLNRVRLRALVLLLRHSGLRLGDAVTLAKDRIEIIRDSRGSISEGKLFLYTAKTGTPVYCPLPAFVVTALEAIPTSSRFYFWNGDSERKGLVGSTWWRPLNRLFKLAGVTDGHAHRFRDTFAVTLLLAGVPMDRVSILLGHSSIKVTEKHYAPWVKARQEQLESDVRRTWLPDRGAFEGTRQVHGIRVQ